MGLSLRRFPLNVALTGTHGFIKDGAGKLTLGTASAWSRGTTVSGGILALGVGGSTGLISGLLTVNSGVVVDADADWSVGYDGGITIHGGTLNFTGNADNGRGVASTITMTGGTIKGWSFDWSSLASNQTLTLTTVATDVPANLSGGINLRVGNNQSDGNGSVIFDVADGAATDDLLVSGPISLGTGQKLIKSVPAK